MNKENENYEEFKKLSQKIFDSFPINSNVKLTTRRFGSRILTTYTKKYEFCCKIKLKYGKNPNINQSDILFENCEKSTKLVFSSCKDLNIDFSSVVSFFKEAIKTYDEKKNILQL
jgi:hypothetical protein